ncbi:serine hydrolase domain-containing protein [Aliikangiella coralliicola]|uniref:Beta-lactamase family protein n=1 Tax=Aliikangiella coralliicola TaxID=2592383 RepID=A0A545UFS7_9GAMM|nr:serine hydrolase domain-containing protein [Aliikangiella coralliicola]TQV88328.1 beta-lactamase family protein [Aliikangiella coralliicola]
MKKLLTNIIALTIFLVLPVYSKTDFSFLDQFVKENKKVIELPSGTAVAIINDDKIVYEGYFGYADIEARQKVDEKTSFYIASMTKPFFALATLLKEHQGDISENTSLRALFPKMSFNGIQPETVTVKHLLSHTSGIDNHPLVLATAYTGIHDNSIRNLLVRKSYPHENVKLNQFEYTNVGYNILSVWFENKFGQSWQKSLHDLVLTPLKTKQTSTFMSDAKKHNWKLAKGYSVKSEEKSKAVYLSKQDNTMHAAGGMISNARDLSRFIIAQINQGIVDGKQVFPSKVIEKSHEVQTKFTRFGEEQGYAWGWFTRKLNEKQLYVHRGGFSGFSTYMSFIPEEKLGLIVLSNQDKWGGDLAFAIEDAAYGKLLGKKDSEIKKELAEQLTKTAQRAKKFKEKNALRKKAEAIIKSELTLDKAAYAGIYSHSLLGDINIQLNTDKQLAIHWGNMYSIASFGEKPESARIEFVPNSMETLEFQIKGSNVESLRYKEYLFRKYP